jgi:pimeloyl-ACP methyl ester carboxylesterase
LVREAGVTTWVLLRGWTREARHWGDFPQRLQARLPPGDRVLTPDLPGCGSRHAQRSALQVDALASAVREEILSQGHRGPYGLLGLSLGGMVACAWAHRHPEELAGCILVNSSLRACSPFRERLQLVSLPAVARVLLAPDAVARERRILALTSRLHVDDPALVRAWAGYARDRPPSVGNALRQLVAAARFRGPPVRPACPMLLLASAGDGLVSPRCSQAIARNWHVPLHLHPRAGHDLPLDAGDWVADAIGDWAAAGFGQSFCPAA